jgi:acetaldehyde dehydrogenase
MNGKLTAAIVGPGNIGTDLMFKLLRHSAAVEPRYMVGVDPASDGLARASRLGPASERGRRGLAAGAGPAARCGLRGDERRAHAANAPGTPRPGSARSTSPRRRSGRTSARPVNLDVNLDAPNLNMITCGGQATVPIVPRSAAVVGVPYAEIVASDRVPVGRAGHPGQHRRVHRDDGPRRWRRSAAPARGKAIIILNPVEPPMIMRNTVFCAIPAEAAEPGPLRDAIEASITRWSDRPPYVPGYGLRADPQFDGAGPPLARAWPGSGCSWRSAAAATTCPTTPATSTSSPLPRPGSGSCWPST